MRLRRERHPRLAVASLAALGALLAWPAATAAADSVSGTIQVSHSDNFVSKRAGYRYSLITNSGRRYRLDVRDGALPEGEHAPSVNGRRATVRGRLRGGTLQEQSLQLGGVPARAAGKARAAAATITRRIAVVNVQFSSTPKFPNTKLVDAASRLDGYVAEASGGGLDLAGVNDPHADVVGPYAVPRFNPNNSGDRCPFEYWADQAEAQAAAQGIDLSNPGPGSDPVYDTVGFVFPHTSCGFGGLADLGGNPYLPQNRLWLNGVQKTGISVFGHELGHNLGAMHASRLTSSSFREYGDPYDVMGSNRSSQYNNFFKSRMGVIGSMPPQNFGYVTQSGNYTLAPNDSSLAGTQAYLIPRPVEGGDAGPWIALEIRHPFGVFNNKPGDAARGVTARIVPTLDETTYRNTMLVAKPFRPGSTFDDAESGITVRVNSISAGGEANVDITTATTLIPRTEPVANLRATKLANGRIEVEWDTPGISSHDLRHWDFNIYRNNIYFNSTGTHSYIDQVARSGSSTYKVIARDYWTNESLPATVTVP